MDTFIYAFKEGSKEMKDLLGGKGANLAEMTGLGLPVPQGFTITTEYCNYFLEKNAHHPDFEASLDTHMKQLEEETGKQFGSIENPLLLSVRSGAKFSMPGMMDTVLNLGLNDETIKGIITKTNNERFAYDAYRRFINMFGNVVLDMSHEDFESKLEEYKKEKGYEGDLNMTAEDWKSLVEIYKQVVKEKTGKDFPTDPKEQLALSILAVFKSWNNKRAISYRNLHGIDHKLGTAVNIQSMVFGNMGDTSATGVAFTRNPATGEKGVYGEYLHNAQGEDVVAGIRTPKKMNELEKEMPEIYKQLTDIFTKLEEHYKDMQDIEFTVEEGTLYMLQTRTGKRTAPAAIRIANDLVNEGFIDEKEAILRIEPQTLDQLLHPIFDPSAKKEVLTKGLPASPGAAVGKIVFTAEDAVVKVKTDKWKVILVRHETSPEDIEGMNIASGILTSRGGMTSHAAVVARGMGKCCVAGAEDIRVDYNKKEITVGDVTLKEGDTLSLDGSTGEVIAGEIKTIDAELTGPFEQIMLWADKYRTLGVRTNADTPNDAKVARKFGAEGIGLCRTEHMFFDKSRINHMRAMIVAANEEERKSALHKLLPFQKEDFIGIFEAMDGQPVTIRLLDPPLHEFLPSLHEPEELEAVAKSLSVDVQHIKDAVIKLHEQNPMLGHRGCRLSITFPEIAVMQVEAIIAAACEAQKKGIKVLPEIMIPLTSTAEEMEYLEPICRDTAKRAMEELGVEVQYLYGTMIETPRGVIVADKIAKSAEFFSYGTNDLTQMGFGFSRDDVGKFVPDYVEKGILPSDPFQKLDQSGIGEMVRIGVEKGRSVKKDLKIGICGEHGGEPSSVEFCHNIGLNYVSCSPFRVPIARLAAAQAALRENK